jgi:hypothetical protein
MKPRKSFLLRMNPELFESLETWARQELRSVNGQIEFLLKEAVIKRDRKSAERLADAGPDDEQDPAVDGMETSLH